MLTPIVDFFTKTKVSQAPIPASLFYTKAGFSVGDLKLDLLLSEDHALTSRVSTHPVEDGSVISDHIQNELQVGSLRGLVSNFSVSSPWPSNDASTDYATIVQNRATGLVQNKSQAAWEALRKIHEARQPITIVTCLQTYNDVVITDITTTRDDRTGEALDFTLSFQQIKRVKLKTVAISATVSQPYNMDSDINRKAAMNVNSGQKVSDSTSITVDTIKIKE